MTGQITVAPDSTGKSLGNETVTYPAGTIFTNADGSTITLTSPTVVFREHIIASDPNNPYGVASVANGTSGPDSQAFGLTVRLPPGQPDLAALAGYLQDMDSVLNQILNVLQSGLFQPLGAIRTTTLSQPIASPSQAMPLLTDAFGRLMTVANANRADVDSTETTITGNTETTIIPALPNTYQDLIALLISNTSATAVRVDIRDQSSTVGNPPSKNGVIPLFVPAGDTRGLIIPGPALYQSNPGQAWTATVSSAVTDIRVWAYMANVRAS